MKIGIVGDIHWSKYSSIVRLRGNKYSFRLENCINSINWAESVTCSCNSVVYLGDFFDSSDLNAEEITALKEISWNFRPHYFLVGNHELSTNDLTYSSSHLFEYINAPGGATVIDKPYSVTTSNITMHFLPYILEEHRKLISEHLVLQPQNKNIIFSHNDIAGLQLGKYVSKTGFKIDDIESSCNLFINGHIHNGDKITDKIINIGNLTGQNFNENAFKYDHCVFILDTNTLKISVYENPYAINFYKLDSCENEINLNSLKNNAVVTLKVNESNYESYKQQLESCNKILTSRIIIVPTIADDTSNIQQELISVNHIDKFRDYVTAVLGTSSVVLEELDEVLQ